jgi:hypothetical protein
VGFRWAENGGLQVVRMEAIDLRSEDLAVLEASNGDCSDDYLGESNDLLEIFVGGHLNSDEVAVESVVDPTDLALVRHLDSHHHFDGIDPQGGYLLEGDGDSHRGVGWSYSYHLDDWDIDRHEYSLHCYNLLGEIDPVANCG